MKFYLSESGNDLNPGTLSAPLKSLSKLSNVFRAGDEVFLKSGETFFGTIPEINASENVPVIFSAYGFGTNPTISGYKKIISWIPHTTNIWKVNLANVSNILGNTYDTVTNTGHLLINSQTIKGDKKFSLSELVHNFQFYNDTQHLYLYLETNPSEYVIEAACRKNLIALSSGYQFYGVDVCGTGAHGFSAGASVDGVIVSGCKVYNIGGSLLEGFGNGLVRYGNGIQFWDGGKNALIENCKIENCYDVAFTLQGQGPGWENIVFRYNEARSNSQSLEFWVKGGQTGFHVIRIYNNKFFDAGFGWGYDVRPDKNVSAHVVTYDWATNGLEDIIIENNLFYKSRKGLSYNNPGQEPGGQFISRNNHIFLDEGQIISANESFVIEDYASYVNTKKREVGSNFYNLRTSKQSEDVLKIVLDKVSASISSESVSVAPKTALPEYISRAKAVQEAQFLDYETNISVSTNDAFARICTLEIAENNCRAVLLLAFSLVSATTGLRYDAGQLYLRIIPFSGLGGATVSVLVSERMGIRVGFNVPAGAFQARIETADGQKVKVSLYYNLGVEPYTRLVFKPISFYTDATRKEDILTFFDRAAAVSSLTGAMRKAQLSDHSLFFSKFSELPTGSNNYVKISQFEIYEINVKAEAIISYMLCDDGAFPRGATGEISVQIVPNAGLTDANCDLIVIEKAPFLYNYSVDDFRLIKEVSDGIKVIVSLWFNVGKKQYTRIQTKKLHFYSRDSSTVFTMFEDIAPVTLLPSGIIIAARRDIYVGTKVFDIPALGALNGTTTTVTVPGAVVGMYAYAKFSLVTGLILSAEVTSANTITVIFFNPTGSTIDIGSGTITATAKLN